MPRERLCVCVCGLVRRRAPRWARSNNTFMRKQNSKQQTAGEKKGTNKKLAGGGGEQNKGIKYNKTYRKKSEVSAHRIKNNKAKKKLGRKCVCVGGGCG